MWTTPELQPWMCWMENRHAHHAVGMVRRVWSSVPWMDGTGLPFESPFSWNCDGAFGLSSHRTGLHPTGQVGHGHGSHPIRRMEGWMEPRGSWVHSATQARMVPFRHEVRILSFHPGIQEVDRWHPPWHPRASTCVGEGPPPAPPIT